MDASPRRRWLRFSLRGLLVFMAVASALVAWRVKAVRDVDNAVANLKRAGLTIVAGWHGPTDDHRSYWRRIFTGEGTREWDVHGKPDWYDDDRVFDRSRFDLPIIDDKLMLSVIDDLRALGPINVIELQATAIGDETLRGLSSLRQVRTLQLIDTAISDAGLVHLEKMKQLEYLNLGNLHQEGCTTTREGTERLRRALVMTEMWNFNEGRMGGAGMGSPFDSDESIAYYERRSIIPPQRAPVVRFRRPTPASQPTIESLTKIIELEPKNAIAFWQRGYLHAENKDYEKAIPEYSESLSIEPGNVDVLQKRALALAEVGEFAKAIADLDEAIRIDPKNSLAHNSLARYLAASSDANVRDGKRAVEIATKSCELNHWNDCNFLDTLAVAYAETGDFANAVKWSELATSLAKRPDKPEYKTRLDLFRASKPYHDPPPKRAKSGAK